MGLLKFKLTSPAADSFGWEPRKAYVTGLDRTPGRVQVETKSDAPQLLVQRDTTESGRLFIPWKVEGAGTPMVGTATLSERGDTYELAVELARGKLNDVRNQLADWRQMGLRTNDELQNLVTEAQKAFFKAATSRQDPAAAFKSAQKSISLSFAAAQKLIEAYVSQVLQNRLAGGAKLPSQLAIQLDDDPGALGDQIGLSQAFNTVQIGCRWNAIAPIEGKLQFDAFDRQLAWAQRHRMAVQAGPLIDLHPQSLPDWLYIWQGDFDAIQSQVLDYVRQVMVRYKGKVATWHLVNRPATTDLLGLSEEEQIRLTARILQIARQVDPGAQALIDLDRPWAEWMNSSPFQLGPLHLADYLARAELGMVGVGLEIAPGYSAPGSHMRDLLDFSKLLDLYSLLNFPLYLTFAFPSSPAPDLQANPNVRVDLAQHAMPPSPGLQEVVAAQWIALAIAKPFVRSVAWRQLDDSTPHLYPNAGLLNADRTPKPILNWFKQFRSQLLT